MIIFNENPNTPSADEGALAKFADMIVTKIESLQVKWSREEKDLPTL